MGGLGVADLKENIRNLLPSLREAAEMAAFLPNASALFILASVRATVAENLVALRALSIFNAASTADLHPDQAFVIHIVGAWALPTPPPALEEKVLNQEFPVHHDLSAEAAKLREGGADPDLSDIAHLLRADLEIATNDSFDNLIQAVFTAGSAHGADRNRVLPAIAKHRADFVAKSAAMILRDALSVPGGTVNHLPEPDKQFLAAVRHWGGTFSIGASVPDDRLTGTACRTCGRQVSQEDRFCAGCGSALG